MRDFDENEEYTYRGSKEESKYGGGEDDEMIMVNNSLSSPYVKNSME